MCRRTFIYNLCIVFNSSEVVLKIRLKKNNKNSDVFCSEMLVYRLHGNLFMLVRSTTFICIVKCVYNNDGYSGEGEGNKLKFVQRFWVTRSTINNFKVGTFFIGQL